MKHYYILFYRQILESLKSFSAVEFYFLKLLPKLVRIGQNLALFHFMSRRSNAKVN